MSHVSELYEMQQAKELFGKLVEEFNTNAHEVLDPKIYSYVRRGSNPQKGVSRYQKDGYSLSIITGFQSNMLIQLIRNKIREWKSTRDIIEWVIANDLWHRVVNSVEFDLHSLPSISTNIAAGFLVRNFEINDHQFIVNDRSFEIALQELTAFLKGNELSIISYVSLMGPSGDLSPIRLADNVAIIQCDAPLKKAFNRFYSSADDNYIEMFDGDYVLEFSYRIQKDEIFNLDKIESGLIKKWRIVPLLAGTGNIEIGKLIRVSRDWPLVTIEAPNKFFMPLNPYDNFLPSSYKFTKEGTPLLDRAIQIASKTNISAVDKHILHALERIIKAKAAKNLNDKVVELALAMEYLINTSTNEVSLQLRVKGTILYNVPGEEEKC